jgi:hypothetical protein
VIDRSKTQDTPWGPAAFEADTLFGTCVAQPILASGHGRPRKQAGHMSASDSINHPQKALASTGAVHIWTPAFAGATELALFGKIVSPSHPPPTLSYLETRNTYR